MNKPNFYIVGAAKSGTTTLHNYLQKHPEIYLPSFKEPHYFARNHRFNFDVIKNRHDYYGLFSDSTAPLKGEASTAYLYYSDVPAMIHAETPNSKIIVILRHPTERALSMWGHQVREGLEKNSLEEAIKLERLTGLRRSGGVDYGFNYLSLGFVAKNIRQYQMLFGDNNVLLLDYKELRSNPKQLLNKVCAFLGAKPIKQECKVSIKNASGNPQNKTFHRFLNSKHPLRRALVWPIKLFMSAEKRHAIWSHLRNQNIIRGSRHHMKPDTRKILNELFQSEIQFYQSVARPAK